MTKSHVKLSFSWFQVSGCGHSEQQSFSICSDLCNSSEDFHESWKNRDTERVGGWVKTKMFSVGKSCMGKNQTRHRWTNTTNMITSLNSFWEWTRTTNRDVFWVVQILLKHLKYETVVVVIELHNNSVFYSMHTCAHKHRLTHVHMHRCITACPP